MVEETRLSDMLKNDVCRIEHVDKESIGDKAGNRLDALGILPGAEIKLERNWPTYKIVMFDGAGANPCYAIGRKIADNIYVKKLWSTGNSGYRCRKRRHGRR